MDSSPGRAFTRRSTTAVKRLVNGAKSRALMMLKVVCMSAMCWATVLPPATRSTILMKGLNRMMAQTEPKTLKSIWIIAARRLRYGRRYATGRRVG